MRKPKTIKEAEDRVRLAENALRAALKAKASPQIIKAVTDSLNKNKAMLQQLKDKQ